MYSAKLRKLFTIFRWIGREGDPLQQSDTMEIEVYVIPEGSEANTVMQGFSEDNAEENVVAEVNNRDSSKNIAYSEEERSSGHESDTEVEFDDNEDNVENVQDANGVKRSKKNDVESDEDYKISGNDEDSEDLDISDCD